MRLNLQDDIGYVELIDFMGGDQDTVDAARFCYQSEGDDMGDRDVALLSKLATMTPAHNTVFEHSVFRFQVKAPIFVARQWMRHRIGTFNEKSLRYCTADLEFWMPPDLNVQQRSLWRLQFMRDYDTYEVLIRGGIKKEDARAILPTCIYTEFLWTVNAWSLMNYLSKRTDKHAQAIHREYAYAVASLFNRCMPITAQAYLGEEFWSKVGKSLKRTSPPGSLEMEPLQSVKQ